MNIGNPQSDSAAPHAHAQAQRLALLGLLTNIALTAIKFTAGVLGNSYALIADAIESFIDIFGSGVIWVGLRVASRPRSLTHPYGYGKAESLAATVVAIMLFGASIGIAVEAVREIIQPHHLPAWWTLLVLALTIIVKVALYRAVNKAAHATDSSAVRTDAWHHTADAITSAAAFVGISIALIGGPGWEAADDWAALLAAAVIFYNGCRLIVGPVRELLDASNQDAVNQATQIAAAVPGVVSVHKVFARKSGTQYWIDMHAWVNPSMTVREAHTLAHTIKDAIRTANPMISDVLIHVEPAS